MAAITAIGLMTEIGDLARFPHPRKLMGYLGLVPSERSSGERTSRGSITKTGNAHARRLWIYSWEEGTARPRAQQRTQGRALPQSAR